MYSITRRGFRAPQARVRAPKARARRPFNIYIYIYSLASAFGARTRACGARPAMLAPSALAAGAARLSPFFFSMLPLRVIEHPRAFGARPTMLAPSALAAGAARLRLGLPSALAAGAARLRQNISFFFFSKENA